MAARLAAEEEELEEFRMLEQAAADKSINTLLGMLGDQNKNTMGKLYFWNIEFWFWETNVNEG